MSLLLEGTFIIKAPIDKVWDSLFNLDVISSCVPGCESIELIDENTYESIISAQVGPVTARFKSTTRFIEVNPPRHLKTVGEGKDLNKAGTFKQETVVDLREISKGEVEISYQSNVSIVGKLATFGDRIMIAKAKQIEKEATGAFNKMLAGEVVSASKIKVSIWELLTAFFAGLWSKIKSASRG